MKWKFDSSYRDQVLWAASDNGSTGALQAFSRGSIPRRSTNLCALLPQLVEGAVLEAVKSRFESEGGHHHKNDN
jgi:hypothetical protein